MSCRVCNHKRCRCYRAAGQRQDGTRKISTVSKTISRRRAVCTCSTHSRSTVVNSGGYVSESWTFSTGINDTGMNVTMNIDGLEIHAEGVNISQTQTVITGEMELNEDVFLISNESGMEGFETEVDGQTLTIIMKPKGKVTITFPIGAEMNFEVELKDKVIHLTIKK